MSQIDYNAMTEDELIAAVRDNGYVLRGIENPSEAVCLAAMKADGWSLKYIKSPSESVKLAAVTQDAWAIQHIQNPSEAVQLATISNHCFAIKYIENPSKRVKLAAIESDGCVVGDIKNPSVSIQIAAVRAHPKAINFLPKNKSIHESVIATHLIHHPLEVGTPTDILNHAEEILESHCPGLADVYLIGCSIGMSGEELSRTMIEWIESHHDQAMTGAEMAP